MAKSSYQFSHFLAQTKAGDWGGGGQVPVWAYRSLIKGPRPVRKQQDLGTQLLFSNHLVFDLCAPYTTNCVHVKQRGSWDYNLEGTELPFQMAQELLQPNYSAKGIRRELTPWWEFLGRDGKKLFKIISIINILPQTPLSEGYFLPPLRRQVNRNQGPVLWNAKLKLNIRKRKPIYRTTWLASQ